MAFQILDIRGDIWQDKKQNADNRKFLWIMLRDSQGVQLEKMKAAQQTGGDNEG